MEIEPLKKKYFYFMSWLAIIISVPITLKTFNVGAVAGHTTKYSGELTSFFSLPMLLYVLLNAVFVLSVSYVFFYVFYKLHKYVLNNTKEKCLKSKSNLSLIGKSLLLTLLSFIYVPVIYFCGYMVVRLILVAVGMFVPHYSIYMRFAWLHAPLLMKGEFSSFHYAWITSIIIFLVMLFVIPIIASFFDRVSNIGAFKKKLENFVKTFVKVVSVLFLVFLVFGYIDYQSCGSKFGIAKTEDYADCLALRAYEDGVDLDYCKGIGRCEWRLSNLVANSGFLGESVEFCKNYDKQIIDKYGKDPNGQNSAGEMYEGAFLTANSCYSALAQYNDDEAYCFEIDDVLAKDMCFSNLADRRKDPSLCENVVSKQRSLYDTMTAKEKCIRRANLQ